MTQNNPVSRFLHFLATRGMGRALRHRDYALFAIFGWFSTIGFWVQRVGIQWLTWELTHSYAWLGAVAFVEAAFTTIVLPVAGSIADQMDRLYLAKWTQAGAMLAAAVLAAVTMADIITLPSLLLLIAANGVAQGFWTPTRMALVPNLVPIGDMPAAIGVNATLFNLAQFVGPAAAGILIAAFGVGYTFAVNALTYLIFFFLLFFISPHRRGEPAGRAPGGLFGGFLEGLGYIARHPGLGPLMLMVALSSLLMRPFRELFAGYADGLFAEGVQGLSVLASATGFGAAIGALVMANLGRAHGLSKIITVSMVAAAALLAVFGLTPDFTLGVVAAGALAFCLTLLGISAQILVQNTVPDALRGRVMSLWGIQIRGGPAVGAWIMGAMIGVSSFALTFGLAALLFFGVWVYFIAKRPNLKMLESKEEPPPPAE